MADKNKNSNKNSNDREVFKVENASNNTHGENNKAQNNSKGYGKNNKANNSK